MYKGAKADFEKLLAYAKEHELKVLLKDLKTHEGSFDTETLTIVVASNLTYEYKVLTLLHELGHAKDLAARDQKIKAKFEGSLLKNESELSEKDRWAIYLDECAGITYMLPLAKELRLSIPYQKVCVEQEMDRLVYRLWAERGSWPNEKEIKNNRDFLNKIWGIK
jgi:cell division protein ZapA (FtsZ GTPase activity inhibitor)